MSPTVWAVTFGGTLLAAATIIALACLRSFALEEQAVVVVDDRTDIELAFLRGAVASLQKAADALGDHPDWDADEYLRKMADQIILDRPAVWS